jgi:hypothetical protein
MSLKFWRSKLRHYKERNTARKFLLVAKLGRSMLRPYNEEAENEEASIEPSYSAIRSAGRSWGRLGRRGGRAKSRTRRP